MHSEDVHFGGDVSGSRPGVAGRVRRAVDRDDGSRLEPATVPFQSA